MLHVQIISPVEPNEVRGFVERVHERLSHHINNWCYLSLWKLMSSRYAVRNNAKRAVCHMLELYFACKVLCRGSGVGGVVISKWRSFSQWKPMSWQHETVLVNNAVGSAFTDVMPPRLQYGTAYCAQICFAPRVVSFSLNVRGVAISKWRCGMSNLNVYCEV